MASPRIGRGGKVMGKSTKVEVIEREVAEDMKD